MLCIKSGRQFPEKFHQDVNNSEKLKEVWLQITQHAWIKIKSTNFPLKFTFTYVRTVKNNVIELTT